MSRLRVLHSCSGPCSVLGVSVSHVSLTKTGRGGHRSHFPEEETEAQKGRVTFSSSPYKKGRFQCSPP